MAEASLYFASKAAVRSFARCMAAELGSQGIRVNSLSPGLIPTQFFNNSNLGGSAFSQFEEILIKSVPLGRPGTLLEIANAAVYLGSDESSYITAEDLVVDGGWQNV
jgi:NAD(P)-dependent dehydrogenase (short-subunit alcohol dehydrogenase family)